MNHLFLERTLFAKMLLICWGVCLAVTASIAGPLKHVVSTQWLAEHLNDPDLVILQVSFTRNDYKKGHIPGARFIWPQWIAVSDPDHSTELPPVDSLQTVLQQLGINDNSTIVLYGTQNQMSVTTRAIFTLDYVGMFDHTYFLDGGLDKWKAEKREINRETPPVVKGSFTPHPRPEILVSGEWIFSHLKNPGIAVVDARAAQFYRGTDKGNRRKGHIPGAVSIPFTLMGDTLNCFKSTDSIKVIFQAAGVKPGATIIPYCHVGQQASLIYFAARDLGYDVKYYDGAFEDWNVHKNYPVETVPVGDAKK